MPVLGGGTNLTGIESDRVTAAEPVPAGTRAISEHPPGMQVPSGLRGRTN